MHPVDLILFVVAVVGVIAFGIIKGRSGRSDTIGSSASEYFLAGRGLTWWLVGFSLIAANISTEQFVGMSGNAADWVGMAIASYEWMAAITLVIVGVVFLPRFLKCGIYTIPEFLEYRYDVVSRTIMAIVSLVILVGVPTATVVFSGAKVITVFFAGHTLLGLDLGNITVGCWIIGTCAALYVFVGGLKSCAWTDLIWGSALIVGGAMLGYFALVHIGAMDAVELIKTKVATSTVTIDQLQNAGGLERVRLLNMGPALEGANGAGGKLHMIRPATDSSVPWTALVVGLWIPNFFYWGLNQYIMQRTLGSKSLAEGQKGIVFAAALKLVIPFIVVIPGIMAYNMFSGDLQQNASIKNATIVAEYQADAKLLVPFSESFAKLYPAETLEIFAHNSEALGGAVGTVPSEDSIFAENEKLLAAGKLAGLKQTTKLVGYDYDSAFPVLLKNLLKPGLTWFVLAAIFGAVVSTLASMLNSASTLFTMDLYGKLFRKNASQKELVSMGRLCVVVFVLIACFIAPSLNNPKWGGVFTFIQEFQGFVSPGVLAVFLFGFFSKRTPRYVGWLGILLNVAIYGGLKLFANDIAFLNRMAISFGVICAIIALLTLIRPSSKPVELPQNGALVMEHSKGAKWAGVAVCIATVALYIIFW
ncbi:MAG: sodium/solute symporter [Opitutales bacterium]|nr:sodium/solute symporter [Opitutales bacterium]